VIDRKQFEVTNFLSVSQIDAQACSVAAVLPGRAVWRLQAAARESLARTLCSLHPIDDPW